ncbi:MAG: hypothetical protein V3U73_06685 [bacterium]
MRRWSLLFFCLIGLNSLSFAQTWTLPPLSLIDSPTAGTLYRGSYVSNLRAYHNGGLLAGLAVGISNRFYVGISYGGENILGEGKVNWNPDIGFQVAYRLIDENIALPGVSIGYQSQGYGPYLKESERYTIKSRGFYAAASKNYSFLGDLSFHGGVNLSLENNDTDEDLNFFIGAMKSLNPELSVVAEYDLAINDNGSKSIGDGKGYLNIGLRWLFANRLAIQFHFKNLLENKENVPSSNREIKISYLEFF